jgi:hypothetical protein
MTERFRRLLPFARRAQLRVVLALTSNVCWGGMTGLTKWPRGVCSLFDYNGVLGICPCHLSVQRPLDVGGAIIALEITLLVSNGSSHVDDLCSVELEAEPLRVFSAVEQFQFLVLEHGTECGVLTVG